MRKQFSNTTPAAPAGGTNVKWQADAVPTDPVTYQNYSAYVEVGEGEGGLPADSNDWLVNGGLEMSLQLNGTPIGSADGLSVNGIPGTQWFLNGVGE